MTIITSTTFHILTGAPPTPVQADVRDRPALPQFGGVEGVSASVCLGDRDQEIRLVGTPEQLDQLLRDALNALGDAIEAHEQWSAEAEPEAVPA